jgi:hypothetical protein
MVRLEAAHEGLFQAGSEKQHGRLGSARHRLQGEQKYAP